MWQPRRLTTLWASMVSYQPLSASSVGSLYGSEGPPFCPSDANLKAISVLPPVTGMA
jgi:hypothetical protein